MAKRGKKILASELAHSRMVTDIRESILSGELGTGDRLPSEGELRDRYGISVTSVRRGVDILVADGLVVRRQGSGTYIQQRPKQRKSTSRKDTVAIVTPLDLRVYHPFFSEMMNGLNKQLAEFGWYGWYAIEGQSRPSIPRDIALLGFDHDKTFSSIQDRDDLVGLLVGGSLAEELKQTLSPTVPVIALDETPICPYVTYDWCAETACGLRHLIDKGAKNIWVYSGCSQQQIQHHLCGDPEKSPKGVTIHWDALTNPDGLLSSVTREAYTVTTKILKKQPDIDAILVGSDFAAQGTLDALHAAGPRAGHIHTLALCNRTSQIVTPLPFTRIVADGEEKGRTIAHLLNEHVCAPHRASNQIILRGHIVTPPKP